MIKGYINSIQTLGTLDGPGVRFVVFTQGCNLRCHCCHNPETWVKGKGKLSLTPESLLKKVKRYTSYFGDEGGVTVSGGEPLMQSEFVCEFFKLCKQNNIHTCLDTSGVGENYEELLDYCDLVILDVKELDENKYADLTGHKMQDFKMFLDCCQKKQKKLWLRQVIIPNYNDTIDNVLKLKEFAKTLANIEKIELLPYHDMAKEKYAKLGLNYRLQDVPPMNKQECKVLENLLNK
jgi:pyruvate formate lyase activating enzyme